MKLYKFVRQRDESLVPALNSAVSTIVAAPSVFGLSASIASSLNTQTAAFETAVQNLKTAELAYREAVQTKESARIAIATSFALYLGQSYATPTVTNAALASIGLDPKPVTGPVSPPVTPADLLGEALSTGRVKLRWKRLTNTSSTVFHVEAQIDGGNWEEMWSGTRTRIELTNIVPGTPISFRVYAEKGDMQSDYSNILTFYAEGGEGSLQLAA